MGCISRRSIFRGSRPTLNAVEATASIYTGGGDGSREALLHERVAAPQNTHHHAFDDERIFLDVDADGFEVRVLGQQPHHRTVLLVTLDGDFVFEARHDDLAIAH